MKRQMSDMVVIITGASAGIGQALARELSSLGAKLALAARRIDRLDSLNRELGGKHLVIAADVSKPEDCQRLVADTAVRFGRIDTLVCNAGYGFLSSISQCESQRIEEIVRTNVYGTIDCIRAAVPIMKKQELRDGCRGQIMIVSSAVARRSLPYFGIYSATKAAQLSIAEALRIELKRKQIFVSSVHPIGTSTEFFDVSAKNSGRASVKVPGEFMQSPKKVAIAMRKAMEKPKPEVWPFRAARIGLGLAALFPRLTDFALSRRGGGMFGGD